MKVGFQIGTQYGDVGDRCVPKMFPDTRHPDMIWSVGLENEAAGFNVFPATECPDTFGRFGRRRGGFQSFSATECPDIRSAGLEK